jgi:hypothetical protein
MMQLIAALAFTILLFRQHDILKLYDYYSTIFDWMPKIPYQRFIQIRKCKNGIYLGSCVCYSGWDGRYCNIPKRGFKSLSSSLGLPQQGLLTILTFNDLLLVLMVVCFLFYRAGWINSRRYQSTILDRVLALFTNTHPIEFLLNLLSYYDASSTAMSMLGHDHYLFFIMNVVFFVAMVRQDNMYFGTFPLVLATKLLIFIRAWESIQDQFLPFLMTILVNLNINGFDAQVLICCIVIAWTFANFGI